MTKFKRKLQRLFEMSPFARTQASSGECHWSIASSMTLCSRLSHTSIKRCFRSSTSRTFAR